MKINSLTCQPIRDKTEIPPFRSNITCQPIRPISRGTDLNLQQASEQATRACKEAQMHRHHLFLALLAGWFINSTYRLINSRLNH